MFIPQYPSSHTPAVTRKKENRKSDIPKVMGPRVAALNFPPLKATV